VERYDGWQIKPIRLGGLCPRISNPRIGWITDSKQPCFLLLSVPIADPNSPSHGGPLPNGYFPSSGRSWIVNCQEPQSFKRPVLISWFPFTSPLVWFLPLFHPSYCTAANDTLPDLALFIPPRDVLDFAFRINGFLCLSGCPTSPSVLLEER